MRKVVVGVIELVLIVLAVSFVVFTSKVLGYLLGINPWLLGIPISGLAIWALWCVKSYLVRNHLPECKNDSCTSYKLIVTPTKEFVHQCIVCGQQYVEKPNRFFILASDGKLLGYKRKRFFFSKWEND